MGSKDIEIRKVEFVTKTQLFLTSLFINKLTHTKSSIDFEVRTFVLSRGGHTLQGYLVVVILCRDISSWSYSAGISRRGHTLQGYPFVVILCRDISSWPYFAGISLRCHTLQRYPFVVMLCRDNLNWKSKHLTTNFKVSSLDIEINNIHPKKTVFLLEKTK